MSRKPIFIRGEGSAFAAASLSLTLFLLAAGCSWRPSWLRNQDEGATSLVDAAKEEIQPEVFPAADASTPAASPAAVPPPAASPAPIINATTLAPESESESELQSLEQLLGVNVLHRDSNQRPIFDGNGLAVHVRAVGWRRNEEPREGYHWTHAGWDRYLSVPPMNRPDLRAALNSSDPVIVATATIGLARLEGARRQADLRSLVHPFYIETETGRQLRTHDIAVRRAAIETLSMFPTPSASPAIDELLLTYGVFQPNDPNSRYDEELHAELLYALARMIPAGRDMRFLQALEMPAPVVQRAALDCLLADMQTPLPRTVLEMIASGHSTLRVEAIQGCGARRDKAALPQLLMAAQDHDLAVRLTAIDALGQIGGDEVIDVLRRMLAEGKTRIQESAVSALAKAGDLESVVQASYHDDWRVRRAAARGLANAGDDRAQGAIAALLRDNSGDVQVQAVASLEQWPLEQAGPLLLMAAESSNPSTRLAAYRTLASRWPPAAEQLGAFEYPFGGPRGAVKTREDQQQEATLRSELLAHLEYRWQADFGGETNLVENASHAVDAFPPAVGPRVDEAVAALRSPHPGTRRAALEQVAAMSQRARIPDEALTELSFIAARETDPANWLLLLQAASSVHCDASRQIAYEALRQPLADVRVAACRVLEEDPSPAHTPHLFAQFDEQSPTVAAAALEALGACSPLEDTMPIELLLASPNHHLRVDAAAALVRLGVLTGSNALLRLAHDPDTRVAIHAVNMMGRLQDPLFLHMLISLLDERFDVSIRRAALSALPQVIGHDVTSAGNDTQYFGAGAADDQSLPWRSRRWRAWYESGGRSEPRGR